MSKPHIVTASELQRSSGKVLRRITQDNQHLIVERDGYRVAAMMPYPEYEALMRLVATVAHRQLVRALGARAEQHGMTETELSEDVDAAKRKVHAERYRNAGIGH
jgi:Antitoxin Phd_YefM, type II toxin-antitoxin system